MAKMRDDTNRMPLVLLPGTLCDARLFAPLFARLPAREATVGDMHGSDQVATVARHLLDKAPDRFALLGFSLGAIVALEAARQAPGRIAGLALVGGTPRDVPVAHHPARRAAAAGSDAGHVIEALWPDYVADPTDRRHRPLLLTMARACPPDAFARQTEMALSRRDARAWLPGLLMPTLVLAGAEDRINPPAVQRAMAALMPAARLVLVPGAGHFALLERPDACAQAVGEWLAAVDEPAMLPFSPVRTKEMS